MPKKRRYPVIHTASRKADKNGKMRSSPEARRLIRAALEKSKSYSTKHKPSLRRAALLLHLPNHAQLVAMRDGRIADTPAMRAELKRRAACAERAYNKEFYMIDSDHIVHAADVLPLAKSIEMLAYELAKSIGANQK